MDRVDKYYANRLKSAAASVEYSDPDKRESRLRRIYNWRCNGLKLREIAEIEGITIERVRQLLKKFNG